MQGYTFAGWYDGTTKVSDSANYDYVLPSKDVTLTAKYTVNKYTVSVKIIRVSSYVDITNISVSGSGTYDYKDTVTIKTTLDNDSHYIYYYRTNASGSWVYLRDNENNLINTNPLELEVTARNFSVYVYIYSNTKLLQVSKSSNTGSEGNAPKYTLDATGTTEYSSANIQADRIVKLHAYDIDGYTFTGWYVKDSDTQITTEKEYQFNMPYETTYYEARYVENKYSLTLNRIANDNDDDTDDTTLISTNQVTYKDSKTCTVTAMTGYTFIGWFESGSDEALSTELSFDYTMPKQNMTLEARFEINQYNVYITTYMSNTDYEIAPATWNYDDDSTNEYDYNTKITYTVTAKAGWTFLGYYGIDGSVSFDRTDFNDGEYELICETTTFVFTVPAKDYTIFPMFKANSYNILYNPNGGSVEDDLPGKSVLMGASFELDVPTREGKDFIGWRYSNATTLETYFLTNENGESLEVYNIPENITVMAIWGTQLQTVTFETGYDASTYDENDTKQFTQRVEYNKHATEPSVPTRKGYTFDGWYTTNDETGSLWNFETGVIVEPMTLYAHWTIKTYTVKLYNWYSGYGYFTYSVTGTSTSGTINYNVTSSNATTITVEYKAKINVAAYFYKGRRMNYWGIKVNGGTLTSLGYNNSITVTDSYDSTIDITLVSQATEEMKYFNFNSDTANCNIVSVASTYTSSTSLVVPNIVTGISAGAFANCTSLKTLTVPFTGTSKSATGAARTMAYLFGTTELSGTTSRNTYYWSGSALATGTTRYIPSQLNKIIVTNETSIYPCAFAGMFLNYVEINNGVTSIGQYAFYYCNFAENNAITFPSTVTTINDYALSHSSNGYINFTIPNTVTSIGEGVFSDTALRVLNTPFIGETATSTGKESIVSWFFEGSTRWFNTVEQKYSTGTSTETYSEAKIGSYLKEVNITLSNYNVKTGAFMNCKALEKFTKPSQSYSDGSSSVAAYAFYGCTKLNELSGVFYNVSAINSYAFYNCSALAIDIDVTTFSNSLYVYSYAFKNSGITSITVERGNQSSESLYVYYEAFYGCTKLQSVTVTANTTRTITLYGSEAFYGCTSLEAFETDLLGQGGSAEITHTFYGCTDLETVSLGRVYYIGDYMFTNCTNLSSLSFTMRTETTYDFYRTIGKQAFYGTKLKSLDLSGANSIDALALENMPALEELTVPFIGKDKSGILATPNSNYILGYYFGTTSHDGHSAATMHTAASTTATYYYPSSFNKLVVIPQANGTIIGCRACEGISSLKTMLFNDANNYTYSIGEYAFKGTHLGQSLGTNSINFSYGLQYVGQYAFYDLWVKLFALPNSCYYIGQYAFANNVLNSEHRDVTLPDNSNLQISQYAFYSNSITTLTIKKFYSIDANAFGAQTNLTKIEFKCGTNCGTIYANAFLGCTNSAITCTADVTTTVFSGFINNGKLKTDWNLLKAATSSAAAVKLKSVQCTDGNLSI